MLLSRLLKKIGVALAIMVFLSCEDDYSIQTPEVKYKVGDTISWRLKNLDDSLWASHKGETANAIFWARTTINLPEKQQNFVPQGILIYAFGAYEVYWDEIRIGTNGTPGKELDKIGEVDRSFIIPDSLAQKGPHTLALRISQKYHPEKQRDLSFAVGDYNNLIKAPVILTAITYIFAGAFLLTAVYFFILYFNNRKFFPVLLFSISSFLFSLLIIIEYIKFYIPIHYSNFFIRLEIIGILTFLIAFIIPVYFSIQFSLPKRKFILPTYFSILIFLSFYYRGQYDYTTQLLVICMWLVSIIITTIAVLRKRENAIIVLVTLFINLVFYYYFEYDIGLILSFTILLLCMFYILAIQVRKQRQVYEHSLVETSRLKNELLKKKIQPHFLMNTLTSLIDWVEESPAKGVDFIEALAEEFDLLNQVEDKKLIPITQEIQLCKSFLNIMKYRKEITYSWIEQGVDETQKIPPAIIHTLIENGITHCIPDAHNNISFQLTEESSFNFRKYVLRTKASLRKPDKLVEDGTGNKYVKARLTESYGEKWHFDSKKNAEGWEHIITIYN